MSLPSTAVSAQYPVTCPVCAAAPSTPCRAMTSGRVTDTHLRRIDVAYTARQNARQNAR